MPSNNHYRTAASAAKFAGRIAEKSAVGLEHESFAVSYCENTSTIPTPVPPFLPETTAVYAPGCKVIRMADSRAFCGASPVAVMTAELAALPKSSLLATMACREYSALAG